MSEIDEIRAIVAVIETGSFSNAARRLGVAKSIISRRVTELERSLGVRLVNRTTRGISPTEAGLEFTGRGARILSEIEEARDAVARQRGEIAGLLRLSSPFAFGVRHIAPILAELGEANPRLEIDATYTERRVDLLGEHYDAVVRIGQLVDSTLVSRRVATIRISAVASPRYLERFGIPASPGELEAHQCLIYSGSRERPVWKFENAEGSQPFIPSGRFRADSGAALVHAAEAGLGIAALPNFLLADGIEAGRLVPILPGFDLPEQGLFVLRPSGQFVSPKVRALIDLICLRFEGDLPWDRWISAKQG